MECNWQDEWYNGEPVWTRTDDRFYYIKDHLGSIRLTIEDDGSLFAAQDYDPWGKITRSWNPSTPYEKFKFTGKELDSETDYHYFACPPHMKLLRRHYPIVIYIFVDSGLTLGRRARYYDSFKAQWTSPDPLEDKYPGWSSYNYCLGNPVNFWDPDGRLVIIDPALLEPVVDDEGNEKKFKDMNAAEKHRWYFQQWYTDENKAALEKYFGAEDGPDLYFELSSQPNKSFLTSFLEADRSEGDAITTFGLKGMDDADLLREPKDYPCNYKLGDGSEWGINDVKFKVFLNPAQLEKNNNPVRHEVDIHISYLYYAISNKFKIIKSGAWQNTAANIYTRLIK